MALLSSLRIPLAVPALVRPWQVFTGDCRAVLRTLPDNSLDSCVTDPPYELGFMGKSWDKSGIAYDLEVWGQVLRVLKPGAYLAAFGASRTFHRLACAIEDAGFELRDTAMFLYGCLSEDTEILVDGQWEPYHKALAGRLALCYDPDRDEFSQRPIQELFVYDYADTAYRICSDRTDQIVSRNHRCLVERDGRFVFERAEALQPQEAVPVLEGVREVLTAISLSDKRAGDAKTDVLSEMRGAWRPKEAQTRERTCDDFGGVRSMWHPEVASERVASKEELLQPSVLGTVARGAVRLLTKVFGRSGGSGAIVDSRTKTAAADRIARPEQPCVERRGDIFPQARELCSDQIRPMPLRVPADGAQGRIRDGASPGSRAASGTVPATGGDCSPHGPQPAEQPAGEPGSVCEQSGPQAVRASGFTRTTLARVTEEFYTGKVWCVRVPTGAFVARRNGKVFVTGNSGFPKSLNLGDGRGTALKPAFEPIVLARKPLDGTHVEVLARWGTGALNIDACRVPGEKPNYVSVGASRDDDRSSADFNMGPQKQDGLTSIGRWPANVIHDGSEEVLAAFPAAGGQLAKASSAVGNKTPNVYSARRRESNGAEPRVETNKSAARFFYCAKASKADREEGCEDLPIQTGGDLTGRVDGTDGLKSPRAGAGRGGGRRNPHPTVKPTELMRWVVRLVTPAGGQVLDPFTGSGSTGKACVLEGRQFVGVELSPEYVKIAEARIRAVEGRES